MVDNRGKTPNVQDGGIPLIEINATGNKQIRYDAVSKFVDETTYQNWFRKHISEGDVLFSTVGQTALCSIYNNKRRATICGPLLIGQCSTSGYKKSLPDLLFTQQIPIASRV